MIRMIVLHVLAVVVTGCGAASSHATLELANASAMRTAAANLRLAHEEWAADLAAADANRQADVIDAFVADISREVTAQNVEGLMRSKAAFAAALAKIQLDREVASDRLNTAESTLSGLEEIADGNEQMARDSLSLDDEARRYFTAWSQARDEAEKQKVAAAAARKAKRQAMIQQGIDQVTGMLFPATQPQPIPGPTP